MRSTLASRPASCGLRIRAALLTLATLTFALPLADAQEPAELLEQLVDLPTTASRAARATKIANKHELAEWLSAMQEFGSFESSETGVQKFTPKLTVGERQKQLELFVYVPAKYSPTTPAPLMLAAHGTGATGQRQHEEWKQVADELGMLVLSPTASGMNVGYTFKAEERDETLAALRWTRRHFNVDETRIFLSGISRGGHLTWDVALRNPDRFAALAPMIGGPRLSNNRGENTLRYMENVAHIPIRDLQGAKDDKHLISNLRRAFERLESFGATDAKLIEFSALGHSYKFNEVDWTTFLGDAQRASTPTRVVRSVANLTEARSSWLQATALSKNIEESFVLRVSPRTWNRLSDDEKRLKLVKETDKRTARIEMDFKSVGVFEGRGDGIKEFRILLTQEMYDPKKPVSVKFNKRVKKRRPEVSRELLLTEFAERFDRTFLPVAEIRIKL